MPYIMTAVVYLQHGHPFTIFTLLWMDLVTVTVRYTMAFISFQNIKTKLKGEKKIEKILQTFFLSPKMAPEETLSLSDSFFHSKLAPCDVAVWFY